MENSWEAEMDPDLVNLHQHINQHLSHSMSCTDAEFETAIDGEVDGHLRFGDDNYNPGSLAGSGISDITDANYFDVPKGGDSDEEKGGGSGGSGGGGQHILSGGATGQTRSVAPHGVAHTLPTGRGVSHGVAPHGGGYPHQGKSPLKRKRSEPGLQPDMHAPAPQHHNAHPPPGPPPPLPPPPLPHQAMALPPPPLGASANAGLALSSPAAAPARQLVVAPNTVAVICSAPPDGGGAADKSGGSSDDEDTRKFSVTMGPGITIVMPAAITEPAVTPEVFLASILRERGYDASTLTAAGCGYPSKPTEKQVSDYDMEFVAAVRGSDVKRLRQLALEGRHMNACNKYGESIVHMACRRGDLEVLTFLVSTGAILDVADDFGRTPLHDACWTPEPRFDVVTFLLNKNLDMLRVLDKRGSSPLAYIRREHHAIWCAYFNYQKEVWWSIR